MQSVRHPSLFAYLHSLPVFLYECTCTSESFFFVFFSQSCACRPDTSQQFSKLWRRKSTPSWPNTEELRNKNIYRSRQTKTELHFLRRWQLLLTDVLFFCILASHNLVVSLKTSAPVANKSSNKINKEQNYRDDCTSTGALGSYLLAWNFPL